MIIPGKYITIIVALIVWSFMLVLLVCCIMGIIISISDWIAWRKRKK